MRQFVESSNSIAKSSHLLQHASALLIERPIVAIVEISYYRAFVFESSDSLRVCRSSGTEHQIEVSEFLGALQ